MMHGPVNIRLTKARFTLGKLVLSEWLKTEQVGPNDKASDLDMESCWFECHLTESH